MKNFNDIIKEAKRISLTDKERAVARERVHAFVASHPVGNSVRKTDEKRLIDRRENIPSPYGGVPSLYGPLSFNRKKLMPIALILALLVGGGTSFAAEQALPGDTLYPVKVNINEEVRSFVALKAESKAAWDVRRAERRLEEAEKLLSDRGLTDEERAKLEERIAKYSEKVEKRTQNMEAHIASQTLSNLEVTLETHEDILEKIKEKREDRREMVEHILEKVREHAQKAEEKRDKSDDDVERDGTPQSAAEERRTATQNKIAEVEKFIARHATTTATSTSPTVDTSTLVAAQAKIAVAKAKVVEGDAHLTAGEYGKAFLSFAQAHRLAQEAKIIVIAGADFRIEFRFSDDDGDGRKSDDKNGSGHMRERGEESSRERKGENSGEASLHSDLEIELKSDDDAVRIEGTSNGGVRIGL